MLETFAGHLIGVLLSAGLFLQVACVAASLALGYGDLPRAGPNAARSPPSGP